MASGRDRSRLDGRRLDAGDRRSRGTARLGAGALAEATAGSRGVDRGLAEGTPMTLDTYTEAELLAMARYEREIGLQQRSVDRVERSLRKIARIQAELARRAARAASSSS